MNRTARVVVAFAPLAGLVIAIGCTAISGFDELRKRDCTRGDCPADPPDDGPIDPRGEGGPETEPESGPLADATLDGDAAFDAATDADARTDAPPDVRPDVDAFGLPCPTGKGSEMVRVVGLSQGAQYTYCIDRFETTNEQYQTFLDDVAARSIDAKAGALQPALCNGLNESFTPRGTWPPSPAAPRGPVVQVDFCDASAYCAWAGKRLCGKIGGGPNPLTGHADPLSSEWFNACTSGDPSVFVYPYGANYEATRCNGGPTTSTVEPGSKSGCTAPDLDAGDAEASVAVRGVFDLSGNVYEWENSCGSTIDSNCFIRGGSFQSRDTSLRCSVRATGAFHPGSTPPAESPQPARPDLGIRCCAD